MFLIHVSLSCCNNFLQDGVEEDFQPNLDESPINPPSTSATPTSPPPLPPALVGYTSPVRNDAMSPPLASHAASLNPSTGVSPDTYTYV